MMDQWEKWEPINNLAEKYCLELILDTLDDFKIILSEEKNRNKKLFIGEHVPAYRIIYDFNQDIIHNLEQQYGKDFFAKWTFFKVNNSSYLKWISEESCTFSDDIRFTHFCIVGVDFILDIIEPNEPKLNLFEDK